MARPKLELTLTDQQHQELRRLLRAPSTSQQLVQRARIVLAAAEGLDNKQIALQLGISKPPVGKWRQRFLDHGLAGLSDKAGRGRKSTVSPSQLNQILTEVVQPPKERPRWSCRTMANHAGVSKDTVQRVWRQNDLKPHLTRSFKVSRDPEFERKFWDIIGVYLNPPTQAVVLCCDEKSQCQALERTQPGLPLGQGHICTRTHDYHRHGTVTLFAALNYLNGKIIAQTAARHRHQEWLKFLKQIDQQVPAQYEVHLILDNYSTHKHEKVKRWLQRRPRFHLHFTPTSSSWLNLVERFFRDLSEEVITPGSFGSVKELTEDILGYLSQRNLKPTRYEWKAEGREILEKIQRAKRKLGMKSDSY